MKTTKQEITRTVYVYAEAKSNWELENLTANELPYKFQVKGYDFGDEQSVRIMEQEITVSIPAGIDLTTACIENLKEKIDAIEAEAEEEVDNLKQRILALARIEYHPDPDELETTPNDDGDFGLVVDFDESTSP